MGHSKTYLVTLTYYCSLLLAMISAMGGYFMSVKNGIFINTESELRVVIYTILIFYTLVSVPVALKFFAENTKAIENEEDEELQEKMIVRNGVIRILLIGLGLAINVLFYYLLKEQSLIYMAGISAVALFFAKPKRYKN